MFVLIKKISKFFKKTFIETKKLFIKHGHRLKKSYRPIFKKLFSISKPEKGTGEKHYEPAVTYKKIRLRQILLTFSIILLYGGLIMTAWALNSIISTEKKVDDMSNEISGLISDNQKEPISEPNEIIIQDDNLTGAETTEAFNDSTALKSSNNISGLGIIVFNSLDGKRIPLVNGATPAALRYGAGHHPKSAQPGGKNNCLIFGHRDTVFKSLKYLSVGDTITIITKNGKFTYQIEQLKVVEPNDPIIFKTYTRPMLTLVTCYPFVYVGHAPQRYVVVASLI